MDSAVVREGRAGCGIRLRPVGVEEVSQVHRHRAGELDEAIETSPDRATVRVHQSWQACLAVLPRARMFAIETAGTRWYNDVRFQPGDALLFGPETRGLPAELLAGFGPEQGRRAEQLDWRRDCSRSS